MDTTTSPQRRSFGRRLVRRAAVALVLALALVVLAAGGVGFWLHAAALGNLPKADGELRLGGLSAPAVVERDALGIPAIRAGSRRDVALLTGFLHAQDRFFQMDLLRRSAGGELSELMGRVTLEADRGVRIHRFRSLAQRILQDLPGETRELLEAYTEGVHQGLGSQGAPFEYAALRHDPRPWRPEDSLLALLAMFALLQDVDGSQERELTLMHEALPGPLFEFLTPWGTEWDAPLVGEPAVQPPIPGPEVFDLRARAREAAPDTKSAAELPWLGESAQEAVPGSNSWAVAGTHTEDGGALLANEMHLGLSVPNYWYRVSFSWPTDDGAVENRVHGLTLPGTPPMVVGSNGHVAWGFTNSQVDTSDVIVLETDPEDPERYLTPEGPQAFERHAEPIRLRGGDVAQFTVEATVWGPVVGEDLSGRRLVVRTIAAETGAVNLESLHLETAHNVDEALSIAKRSGVPALNFTVADASGRIGWTLIGRVPGRLGFDGRLAGSWADGQRRWNALAAPEEVPQVVDPESGRIWTANNRTMDGATSTRLGADGYGYVLGARARQIRDALFARDRLSVEDMRQIQLDDRGLLLARWRDLLLEVLTPEVLTADPRRRELRQLVESWGGRAAVDSAGYRLVRTFRLEVGNAVFGPLATVLPSTGKTKFRYFRRFRQAEGPLWALVTERPVHLLDPRYTSWDDLFLTAVDEILNYFLEDGRPLSEKTWGRRNIARISHPFSRALPVLGRWLDMPRHELPGDNFMPRVQSPVFGASMRMVVSPGHEEEGFLHMPGGQSGNPLSPHYNDAHVAWAEGEATPFLPGPTVSTLQFLPLEDGSS